MSQEDWDVRTLLLQCIKQASLDHRDGGIGLTRSRDRPDQLSTVPTKQLCSKYAQALFRHGQKVAESKGLILVDTKYEFGKVSHSGCQPVQGVFLFFGGWKGIYTNQIQSNQTARRASVGLLNTPNAHQLNQHNRTRTGRSSSSTRCTRPTPPATGSRRPTTRASRRCVRGSARAALGETQPIYRMVFVATILCNIIHSIVPAPPNETGPGAREHRQGVPPPLVQGNQSPYRRPTSFYVCRHACRCPQHTQQPADRPTDRPHHTPLPHQERCDPYNDATLPEAPPELVNELSRRYIMLYELITGRQHGMASQFVCGRRRGGVCMASRGADPPVPSVSNTGLDFQFPEEGSSTNDSLREQLAAYYKK